MAYAHGSNYRLFVKSKCATASLWSFRNKQTYDTIERENRWNTINKNKNTENNDNSQKGVLNAYMRAHTHTHSAQSRITYIYIFDAIKSHSPNKIFAVRAECWLLEESRYESMVFHIVDILLFQGALSVSLAYVDLVLLLLGHIIVVGHFARCFFLLCVLSRNPLSNFHFCCTAPSTPVNRYVNIYACVDVSIELPICVQRFTTSLALPANMCVEPSDVWFQPKICGAFPPQKINGIWHTDNCRFTQSKCTGM